MMNIKTTITKALSVPNANIFDECIHAIELEFGKPVTNLSDLKKREDKKKKGDTWEQFCKEWLLSLDKYKNVWTFQEWMKFCIENNKSSFGLKTKQDNGIDLIGQLNTGNFVTIQCKYRKDKKKVTWNSLSTFVGLCERTGPWAQYIVMTNGSGVTRKVPKSKKDKSICIGTFRATERTQWMKMAGLYVENKLTECSLVEDKSEKEEIITNQPSMKELREIRLQKFMNQ
jgi:predicted helicase